MLDTRTDNEKRYIMSQRKDVNRPDVEKYGHFNLCS